VIVLSLASPSRTCPAAANTPRAMTLAGPGVTEADMTWKYSVPEVAWLASGAALAAVMPAVAVMAAAAAARANETGLRMTDLFHRDGGVGELRTGLARDQQGDPGGRGPGQEDHRGQEAERAGQQ
jgi:hypothetical protein